MQGKSFGSVEEIKGKFLKIFLVNPAVISNAKATIAVLGNAKATIAVHGNLQAKIAVLGNAQTSHPCDHFYVSLINRC